MTARVVSSLAIAGLAVLLANPVGAQDIPRPVIETALRHVVEHREGRVVLNIDRFPNADVARSVAGAMSMRAASKADVVQCSDDKETCHILGPETTVISLTESRASGGDFILRLVISTQAERPDGSTRLFPTLREITVSRVDGRWTVTRDETLMRG